ncbi:MAG: Alpha/beta hydrolase [Thermodesulfobacteriota bacterium]|nr:Alpha/beta hydrolase [Thermodesulfobacteriota bacterium]
MPMKRLRDMGIGFRAGSEHVAADRPTLIMIHGAGGSSQIWQNQTRVSMAPSAGLSRSVNALALDLPGHGESLGEARSDIDAYAAWLSEVLSAVFDEPPFLMGHSMGGAIVQKVALSDPDLMKAIILVGTGPRLQVAPMFLEGLQKNFDTIVDTLMGYAYAADADTRLIQEGIKLMKAAGPDATYGDFYACDRFDVRDQIGSINLPCLILCGSEDKLTPPSLSRKLHESIRGSRMEIIPDAGHMVMIEKHQVFSDRVLDFILNSSIPKFLNS